MKSFVIGAALVGAAFALSACSFGGPVVAAGPVEAIVAAEVGYDSYFVQGLEFVGDFACGLGNGSGNWSPDNGGECVE